MKVIVSHDVDHITVWEHSKDLIIPKSIIRNFIELFYGHIPRSEVVSRFNNIIQNQWHNLDELMAFNRDKNIPATFFIGVANGNRLVYSLEHAEFWIKKIMQNGFEVGVHGIAYDNYNDIKDEYDTFQSISGLDRFGIRMHYLNKSPNMLSYLSKAGYIFDSTMQEYINPYKQGNLWEFPLFIMDVYLLRKNSSIQNQSLTQVKEMTKKVINDVIDKRIRYITVNLHDVYFSDSYGTWKEWYIWLIEYLGKNFQFVSYNDAIENLESFT